MNISLEDDLTFTTQDQTTWRRKLFGLEASLATLSRTNGHGFLSGGVSLQLPRPIAKEAFLEYTIAALVHLRFIVPTFGLRCFAEPKESNNFYLEYTVPKDTASAVQWTMDTLTWMDDPASLSDRQTVVDNLYWNSAEAHNVVKLVIGPSDDAGLSYHIIAQAMHGGMDGRGGMNIIDVLCHILNDLLGEGNKFTKDISNIPWGSETERLVPCSVLLAARQIGVPTRILTDKPMEGRGLDPTNIFLRPLIRQDSSRSETLSHATELILCMEDTQRIRQTCKTRGCSLTAFFIALIGVCEVDWTLSSLNNYNEGDQKTILAKYDTADSVYIARNAMDKRPQLEGYNTHDGKDGSPSCAVDTVPFKIPMDCLRRAVVMDTPIRRDGVAFWETVKSSQDYMKTIDVSLPAYISRDVHFQHEVLSGLPVSRDKPGILASSVGDLEKVGIFTRWSPLVPCPRGSERIVISDVCMSRRMPSAMKGYMCWQWDRKLRIRVATGAKWTSELEMKDLKSSWKKWIDIALTTPIFTHGK